MNRIRTKILKGVGGGKCAGQPYRKPHKHIGTHTLWQRERLQRLKPCKLVGNTYAVAARKAAEAKAMQACRERIYCGCRG